MRNKKEYMEFLKWWYEFEHSRHMRMNASMTAVFAAQTAVLGVIFTTFERNINLHLSDPLAFVFLLGAALFFSISAYFSWRSYWGQDYRYIGVPKDVNDLYKNHVDWEEYDRKYKGGDGDSHFQKLYEDYCARFSESIDTSAASNDQKSGFRHRALGFLPISVVFLFLSYFMYL